MKYTDEARRVLHDEASALELLSNSLDDNFDKVIEVLLKIKGRIAVTGLGKSGCVARKTAATLASTGSPAYYIHPVEASHGDLGMISEDDAVIIISNSGNTQELKDIILYCSENGLPMIGITKNKESFLGKHCDYLLLQPPVHEACPLDCAPTTSTTVQMALGDAIALCLLRARGFSAEDFHKYHPGGTLGQKLLTVRDVMFTGDELPLTAYGTLMREALFEMTSKGFGCVGIMKDGTLAGIITDGDLRRHLNSEILSEHVESIMTKTPICLDPNILIQKAEGIFKQKKISCAFVVEDRKPVGIYSLIRKKERS